MNKQRAQQILDAFAGKRVLVAGDVMLDEYVWGKVSRVSPEAPVMVVDTERRTFVPGGAANVVNNLCALGAVASITGLVGQDSAGALLTEKLGEEGANTEGVLTAPDRPTTVKTRIIAHSQQGPQQVVRVDHERRDLIDQALQARVLAFLERAIPESDALLLSDYQKGLLGPELVEAAIHVARRHGKIITGNLKPHGIGPHCRLTVLTMNLAEASIGSGLVLDETAGEERLREAGRLILEKSGADHVLITRGAQGLTLFGARDEPVTVPPHPVEVYDGTGAGDTVVSTLTLALTAGATPLEAVTLANYAGALVVRKVGVAVATCSELLEAVAAEPEETAA